MNWPVNKLTAVCEISMGQAPDGSTYNDRADGLPLVAGAGDFGDFFPSVKKYTSAPGKRSAVGDIILCIRATIGDTNWSDKEYCLGRGVAGLRARDGLLDSRFLWHFISARRSELEARGTGSTFKQVSQADIAEWLIPTPPVAEQQRIAAILDKAHSLRSKRQETISLASELVRSKFSEMFGEPHTNTKGLPMTSLGDLVRLKSGNFLPSYEMAGTGGVFVYGGNGVNGEHNTAMFDEVKLVIGRVGAYCGAVHLTKSHSWITDNALYVSEISPLVRLEYLAFALTQANLNQYSSQSGQPLVSASRLYPVVLVLPPLSLQDVFLEVLDRTTRVQASQTNSLEALEEMSRSLAFELFA